MVALAITDGYNVCATNASTGIFPLEINHAGIGLVAN